MSFVNAPTWIRYRATKPTRPVPWLSLDAWLTKTERDALAELGSSERRTQWLQARWLSKQLISQAVGIELFTDIELITRNNRQLGIAPQVRLAGQSSQLSLSISHAKSGVLVALSLDERVSVGVDLACDVPCSMQFRSLWFSPAEQQWLAEDPARRTGLLWGLKEAVFKACRSAQPWMPTQIEIQPWSEGRFKATFFGTPLDRLDVRTENVTNGVAVVVWLSRQELALQTSSVPSSVSQTCGQVVSRCSSPFEMAHATERVATNTSAIGWR